MDSLSKIERVLTNINLIIENKDDIIKGDVDTIKNLRNFCSSKSFRKDRGICFNANLSYLERIRDLELSRDLLNAKSYLNYNAIEFNIGISIFYLWLIKNGVCDKDITMTYLIYPLTMFENYVYGANKWKLEKRWELLLFIKNYLEQIVELNSYEQC